MNYKKSIEFLVGLFTLVVILSLIFLAMSVSGVNTYFLSKDKFYQIKANFNDIGALTRNSAIRIAGVQIGTVDAIQLNAETFQARVIMRINQKYDHLPKDSSASIQTIGILGDSYISISPGYSQSVLSNKGVILTTYGATNLTSLLSTFASGGKAK